MVNVVLLFYVITEVFPLVGLALFDLGYKVIRFKQNGKEFTLITPEQ